MEGGGVQRAKTADPLSWEAPAPELTVHAWGQGPEKIGPTSHPIAAEAKAAIELGAAGDATQLGPQDTLGQIKVTAVGVGMGRNQQIRPITPEQLH